MKAADAPRNAGEHIFYYTVSNPRKECSSLTAVGTWNPCVYGPHKEHPEKVKHTTYEVLFTRMEETGFLEQLLFVSEVKGWTKEKSS